MLDFLKVLPDYTTVLSLPQLLLSTQRDISTSSDCLNTHQINIPEF